MHPYRHARDHPDWPALVVADSGEILTYRELDEASNQVAHLFRRLDLRPGDRFGILLKNGPEFCILFWAAQRSGLLATLISTHLKPQEAAYILEDSNSRLLVTSSKLGGTPGELASGRDELIPRVEIIFDIAQQAMPGSTSFSHAIRKMPKTPIPDEVSGSYLLYSSGTTGRPKGVVTPVKHGPIEEPSPLETAIPMYRQFDPLVSFAPGPLYHGAPLNGMLITQRLGGTFLTMRKFDAERALGAIQDWGVVHAQFVPTMFVRMLGLPAQVRAAYDVSSLRFVLHAAAPCPIEIKRGMIEWWGPIIHEYYGSSENLGGTFITAEEWLNKPGSVGRSSTGPIHVCDEQGRELPPGAEGIVYFELGPGRGFNYHNDPDKTRKAANPIHPDWYTVGDIGWLDEDGYLYLTDRRDFMIISGGVNIYPQAVEDALIVHPKVADAAVIGVPNDDLGEEVKAIVEPAVWDDAGEGLERELVDWCRDRISRVSCPRSVEFVRELPRLASGKLAKHALRRMYSASSAPEITQSAPEASR